MRGAKARLLEITRDGGFESWTLLIISNLTARYLT
jgi:hypothetical protein